MSATPTSGDPNSPYPSTSVRTEEERQRARVTQSTDGAPALTHMEEHRDDHDD